VQGVRQCSLAIGMHRLELLGWDCHQRVWQGAGRGPVEPFDTGACGAADTACTSSAAWRRAARLACRSALRRLRCAGRGALQWRSAAGGAAAGLRAPPRRQFCCVMCIAAICVQQTRQWVLGEQHRAEKYFSAVRRAHGSRCRMPTVAKIHRGSAYLCSMCLDTDQ
jgi:hypothetical protein